MLGQLIRSFRPPDSESLKISETVLQYPHMFVCEREKEFLGGKWVSMSTVYAVMPLGQPSGSTARPSPLSTAVSSSYVGADVNGGYGSAAVDGDDDVRSSTPRSSSNTPRSLSSEHEHQRTEGAYVRAVRDYLRNKGHTRYDKRINLVTL